MHLAGTAGWRLASAGLIAAGLLVFLLYGSASAELTPKQDKDWAGIAGAWWLDEKCRFLDEAMKAEFEWTVAQLMTGVSKNVGTERALLRIKIVEDVAKQRSCDGSSREIVTWGRWRGPSAQPRTRRRKLCRWSIGPSIRPATV
jgi:hypothetical protein